MIITGGGRGLGRVTAEKLAHAGHRVILTARDAASGQRAIDGILARRLGAHVEARVLDLASFASVRAFAQGILAGGLAVDVLFNIAGVMPQSPTRATTDDGLEQTLQVNALAPFLLTRLLLPTLERAPSARVINVSSRLHLPGSRGEPVRFDFDDPMLERAYNPERAYKNSKLAVLWFTYELQRRLPPRAISANAVCPGFVPATIAATSHGTMRFMMRHVLPHMPFARSIEEATDSFVFMATDPSLEGVGGRFFGEMHPLESSPESHDADKARRFWELAARLTGAPAWPAPTVRAELAAPSR